MGKYRKMIFTGILVTLMGVITTTVYTGQMGFLGIVFICVGGYLTLKGINARKNAVSSE